MSCPQPVLSTRKPFAEKAVSGESRRIRLLVSSPCILFRQAVSAVLRAETSIHMAGVAATGRATVAKVRALRPDVVLLDSAFKDVPGAEVVRRIRQHDSGILILINTPSDAVLQIVACIEAGASGYVSSDVSSRGLISAIQKSVKPTSLGASA